MSKIDAKVLIIDDVVTKENTAWIVDLEDEISEIEIIGNSNEAIEAIKNNIEKRIIIVLDLNFASGMINGNQLLEKIREITFLIPVIIWSAKEGDKETFADLIGNKAFAFLPKGSTMEDLKNAIEEAYKSTQTSISNVIEEWIKRHPESEKDKPILSSSDGKVYTLHEILDEVRRQTETGKMLENSINKLTIDLLTRGKENL